MLTLSETRAREATISRRALLLGTSAVAVAAALPAVQVAPVAAKVAKPPMPTWIVGTPGEWDHEVIRAATREAAVRLRCEECEFEGSPDADPASGEGGPECECEACYESRGFEATRVPEWDGRSADSIGGGDWLVVGREALCDRCGYETSADACGHNVGGKAVCEDCLTLADWDIVDPERAAELRAEQEDEALPASLESQKEGAADSASVKERA